jgi:class 3 adenylate cyclase
MQPIRSATETFQGQRGAPWPLSSERKYVTVLFSDLTGYTSITERLDPEQVKEITGRIFSGVKQIVSKYEGFIERVMGDGVVAFFGIPQAHEDDPIRAVRTVMKKGVDF